MDNRKLYDEVFIKTLDLSPENVETAAYDSTPAWDSVGHLALVTALEDAFGLNLGREDILSLKNYQDGIKILAKHDIQL